MSAAFDAGMQALCITLGSITLPVLSYTLSAEDALRDLSLADGAQKRLLLGEKEILLQIQGRLGSPAGAALPVTLQTALAQHTAYAFSFAGAAFTGMRLVKIQVQMQDNARTAAYTVTMTGRMEALP